MRRRKKIPDYTKKAWPIETGNTCGRFRMTLLGASLCLIFPVLATGTEYTGQITGEQTFSDGDTVHVTTGPAILHDWSKNKVPSQTISGTGKIDVTAGQEEPSPTNTRADTILLPRHSKSIWGQ